MIWLLTEILVFVAAAAVFGAVIGLGLAAGGKRRAVAVERQHQGLVEKLGSLERSQRAVEGKAVARAAAEAAARGDLELRLVEMEQAAADYRARAEAAERRLHLMPAADTSPELVEPALPPPQAAAVQTLQAREIESLKAQLARAERVRARAEIDLAVAHARPEAMRPVAWAGQGTPLAAPANGDAPGDPAAITSGERPAGLDAPRNGRPDDLRRIRGIGPKNEGVLNALGLYHYEQIAALTPANVAWLDAYLKFHGRIARDDWVGQAKSLLGGEGAPSDKVHPQDAGL